MMFINDNDINYPYTMRRVANTPSEIIFGTDNDEVPEPL
jgi:hypothetical protein